MRSFKHQPGATVSDMPQGRMPPEVTERVDRRHFDNGATLSMQGRAHLHNHDKTESQVYYDGYSLNAPDHHVWRCRKKDCQWTSILWCRDKAGMNRGKTEDMQEPCPTCRSLRRRPRR